MKFLTWNCNGAFRNKYHLLEDFESDILIIEECENPNLSTKQYLEWSNQFLWIGENKNKGLGIFVKNKNITIEKLDWSDINTNYKNEKLESFLPAIINNEYLLLGVWTKKANSEVFGYIGQMWKYLQLHKEKLKDKKVIIVGDFNSNSIWDKWDRWWNHCNVVEEFEEINIKSLYHYIFKEEQGKETTPTFYLQRKLSKTYHIDYVFLSSNFLKNNPTIHLENKDKWLNFSDHIPIRFEIKT